MAYAMTKQGSLDNCITYEFMCDTVADMNAIENRYRTIGTVAIVLQGESGMEVYIASSDKQWNALTSASAGDGATTGGLSIYICGQNEVDNGLPDIDSPDETTIYLVSAGNTSGNLYEEYIYVDDAWEKFGAASIDLSNYATKANPVFTGSISLGRKTNTSVGSSSFAAGTNVTASGGSSHAEGGSTTASGQFSHAEGYGPTYTKDGVTYTPEASGTACHTEGLATIAGPGNAAHAEGNLTRATQASSHAEGDSTLASGFAAHAEGSNTTASGTISHAEGYNTTVSADLAHVEGNYSVVSGIISHAEGNNTTASGAISHAEGNYTTAYGDYSHAEGSNTTAAGLISHAEGLDTSALGPHTHAEGLFTIATGAASHVGGKFNVKDTYNSWTEWTSSTEYIVGDKVRVTTQLNNNEIVKGYVCTIAHTSSSTFDSSKWNEDSYINYVTIIGNGTADNARSNAYAIDWQGNGHYNGDVYVNCNSDSTGGNKVATEAFVTTRIPTPPVSDGDYILKVNVSSGTATYSWVALSDLSGVTF